MAVYPKKVFLNGKIIPHLEAKISVFDRGFLFGDGIYEVMLQMNGTFFFGNEHLERLKSCLNKINIDYDTADLPNHINDLLKASNLSNTDCILYIQVTRGVAPRKHHFPENIKPTVLMYATPLVLPATNDTPISVITQKDFRWHRCDIKMTSLLGNVMANNDAIKEGHYETVFLRHGKVTEASHSNIFFVKGNTVYTHPADKDILNGITREVVIQLCKENSIEIIEEGILEEEIFQMDEAFLTGTTTQIAPIKKIDAHNLDINSNHLTKKLQNLFLELKRNYTAEKGLKLL